MWNHTWAETRTSFEVPFFQSVPPTVYAQHTSNDVPLPIITVVIFDRQLSDNQETAYRITPKTTQIVDRNLVSMFGWQKVAC